MRMRDTRTRAPCRSVPKIGRRYLDFFSLWGVEEQDRQAHGLSSFVFPLSIVIDTV